MALETVNVTVKDDQVIPQPVDGVVVRVFDATGTTFITSGSTGVPPGSGKVQFTLPGAGPVPITYQLRFYVNGGAIPSPQYIKVYSPPSLAPVTGTNNFLITASMFTLSAATNPRLCRASGFVWGPDGHPRRGIDIHFIPSFQPLVVDGYGVLGERVSVRTDKDGYASVDLFRSGMYGVTLESQENVTRGITVPDRSSINLFNLLFPIVVSVDYAPVGPWALAVGAQLILTPTVKANDFRTLVGAAGSEDLLYAVDDPTIAGVTVTQTTVILSGNASGSTALRVTRRDNSIVYIPDPGITGSGVTVTVF